MMCQPVDADQAEADDIVFLAAILAIILCAAIPHRLIYKLSAPPAYREETLTKCSEILSPSTSRTRYTDTGATAAIGQADMDMADPMPAVTDYGVLPATSKAMMSTTSPRLMIRRLAAN